MRRTPRKKRKEMLDYRKLGIKMGHVRTDTLTRSVEWAKHLRPTGKRRQAKQERRAAKKIIKKNEN